MYTKGYTAPKNKQRFVATYGAGILWQHEDQILMVSRQKHKQYRRHTGYDWGLPAAKQTLGEQPFNTAARALTKETSVTCYNLYPLLTVPADITGELDFHVYGFTIPPPRMVKSGKYLVRFDHPMWLLSVATYDNAAVYRSNQYILRMLFGLAV